MMMMMLMRQTDGSKMFYIILSRYQKFAEIFSGADFHILKKSINAFKKIYGMKKK